MNSSEARKILGVENNATKEDINSAFRNLAKKHHPDKNKNDPKAEEKFKEINTAYQTLNNPKPEHNNFQGQGNPFQDIQDMFRQNFRNGNPFNNNFGNINFQQSINDVHISFSESILGVEKTLEVVQSLPCNNCNGMGSISSVDSCNICKGSGQKQANFNRGGITFMSVCDNCKGSGKNQSPCSNCNAKGHTSNKINVKVSIPAGIFNGNVLKIPGALLRINVASDPDMSLVDQNVISNIEISLLEALKGVSKQVRTVKGDMNLKIPPSIKNGNSVQVHGYGVGNGSHIFNVKISYPESDKINKIIEILENDNIQEV